jgi:hypothetical protein
METIFMPRTNELTCLALSKLAAHAFKALLLATIFLLLTVTSNAEGDDAFHQTLTSAESGIHLDSWQRTSRDLKLQGGPEWSIRKLTLHGGRQEGVDIIIVDNGKLRFTVIPTRGMGILRVEMGDLRLGWDSPVKEVVHPQFINLESRGGLGWLEGFNEWLVRCGLEFAGHPGKDKFINNVGDEAEMDLTLHGKIANIPASEVDVIVERQAPHRISVRGKVVERMFYGPKLELLTEISTEPGSDTLRVADTVTNLSDYPQEFQVIYHSNYGPPLLGEGSRFVGAVKQVTPFNDNAAKGIGQYPVYPGPKLGFIEQVYCIYPYADESRRTTAMLRNAVGDRAVTLSFSIDELPFFTLWKNTNSAGEGYVTGLEPGTGFPYTRRIEREFGRVPRLSPGQSRHFGIDFSLKNSKEEVTQAENQIASVQAGRSTQVDPRPAAKE